jgi:CRP/FNR family transcriptional regulator, cyclic AMP receptor protein
MASQHVSGRLAALRLEEMAEGETLNRGVLLPAHSQEELAKLIGTTRESVSRTLSTWRAAQVITMRGRRIVVLKPERLGRAPDPGGFSSDQYARPGRS